MTKAEDLTTHAGWGAGYPRLMITGDGGHREVPLRESVTRIGSGPEADIRLEGVAAVAGEIFHDENDEYVFIPHQEGETNADHQRVSFREESKSDMSARERIPGQ